MCGIIGFIGRAETVPVLIDGLTSLEYRGYDSAGIAVCSDAGEMQVVKSKGRLESLKEKLKDMEIHGHIGIGHTRWATHGEPSDTNAHPHPDHTGKIAVVHNGIIENYLQLKEYLEKQGYDFASETDTEVVAKLIGHYYDGDLLKAVSRTLKDLDGTFSLGVICEGECDKIVAARKDNPLIIGYGENCNLLASDIPAILKYTREVCYLNDGEMALLTEDEIKVFDFELNEIEKEVSHIDWEVEAAEKGGYDHFMFKEIMEQPKAIRDTVNPRIKDGKVEFASEILTENFVKEINKIYIIACGSAYHVGVVAKYAMERTLRIPTEAVIASEFRYSSPVVDEKTLAIVISQSGSTLDTLAAMREAKRRGAKTLAIVNVVGSSIAQEADEVIYTWAGPEIAVATTKAYSTQLAITYLLNLYMADMLGKIEAEEYKNVLQEIVDIPAKVEEILAEKGAVKALAEKYYQTDNVFFIGRNLDYAVSLEGSLKLKEISYIHSEAYAAGELKHGTISLIVDDTLVITLSTYEELFHKTVSNIKEVKARGAEVLCLACKKHEKEVQDVADSVICIPETHPMLMPSLAVVPLQLFSYYIANLRGCDIDKPRNLAKSVTVE